MNILYTIDCPMCRVLEKKLKLKKIPFIRCIDKSKMSELGFNSLPKLSINDNILDFTQALTWINSQEG